MILDGPADAALTLAEWSSRVVARRRPGLVALLLPADTRGLPAALVKPRSTVPQAWECRGPQCLPPVGDVETLTRELNVDR